MKWSISQEEFEKLSKADQKSGFFVVEEFPQTLQKATIKEKLKIKGYTEWAYFDKNSQGNSLNGLNKVSRRKYEIFCGGFLYYHDVKFKKYNPKIFGHKIYFDWSKKEKKTVLTIYITKTPKQFNPNPPRPPAPPPPES